MTFLTTFLPFAGLGCGCLFVGLLWQTYRFVDCVVTRLLKKP